MSRAPQLAIAVVLITSGAFAQNRMGGFGVSHFGPRPIPIARGHRFYPGYGYYAAPYFYSDYEPDEEYVTEPPPRPEPAPVVKIEPAPDPLLLELHEGQWVRVNNFTDASGRTVAGGKSAQQVSAKALPPAVIVFRDGHTEELDSYSIIGPAIYTKSDYWKTGKWSRSIQLADIDIPATIERNHARGVEFGLPSSPDEIMIRP